MNISWMLLAFCASGLLGMLNGAPVSDSTAITFNSASPNGKTILDLGTEFDKPLLRLVGRTILNMAEAIDKMNKSIAEHMQSECRLHPCTEWSDWTECPAKRKGEFSMVTRNRTCGYNTTLCTSTSGSTTEAEKMVCEGMCVKNYTFTDNGFCLKLVETKMDKDAAESTCKLDGGHVVNINSQTKSDDAHEILKNQNVQETIWLNGRRADKSSPWLFTYETTVTSFSNWQLNEPSNGITELCMVDEPSRKWYDRACTDKYKFVCEVPV